MVLFAEAPTISSDLQCRCRSVWILNSRMQGTGFAGSLHSRIQNPNCPASYQCAAAQTGRRNNALNKAAFAGLELLQALSPSPLSSEPAEPGMPEGPSTGLSNFFPLYKQTLYSNNERLD